MIPMRRIWERNGEVFTDRFVPKAASGSALTDAERELSRDDSRRQSLKKVFALSSAAGDLGEAARLAERWLEKEPLDPEAITALADVEARRGHRDAAIRMLGSVLDVRPGDTASHKRLARLERWAGHAELGVSPQHRHGRRQEPRPRAGGGRRALRSRHRHDRGRRCAAGRRLGQRPHRHRTAPESTGQRRRAARAVICGWKPAGAAAPTSICRCWIRTDIASRGWAPATRSVISARDATSTSREGLALRGAAPGEYVIELTRGAGSGGTTGELVVTIAGTVRRIPFSFDGDRKAIALLRITMQPRLVRFVNDASLCGNAASR